MVACNSAASIMVAIMATMVLVLRFLMNFSDESIVWMPAWYALYWKSREKSSIAHGWWL